MTLSHILLLSVPILVILGMTLLPVFVIEEVLGGSPNERGVNK